MKKKYKTYILGAFILVALVQLAIPAQMIWNQEDVLSTGVAYKFKTRPIDPNDPFRGKYITLSYNLRTYKTKDTTIQRDQNVYLYLKKDSLGYAAIDTLSASELKGKNDYISVEVSWVGTDNVVNFNLPLDRFYMEETKAYDAEVLTRRASRDTLKTTYALVYVKKGAAVLADVLVNGVPVKDLVEKNKEMEE